MVLAASLRAAALPRASGEQLLGDLGCTACHQPSGAAAAWILPKAAPRLEGLGRRTDPAWLKRFLRDPQAAHPGTTMPDLLRGLPGPERDAAAEALTHFLVAADAPAFRRHLPDRAAVRRGEALYHQVGCVACHDPQDGGPRPAGSVPWPNLAEKWSVDGLQRFLKDPLALRPSGRMPSLSLTDAEAADIAQYLLREVRIPAMIERTRLGGRVRALEDLDTADWVQTGPVADFSLPPLTQERHYALRFTAWFPVELAGRYTFFLRANGSSRLSLADGWRLGQDSWQRESVDAQATLRLDPGWYPLVLDFVQRGSREPSLQLEWSGPGFDRQPLPPSRLRSTREAIPEPARFTADAAKVAAGRALYARFQCAPCHEAAPTTSAPTLAALHRGRGCLADPPSEGLPAYRLAPAQRSALDAALGRLGEDAPARPTDADRIALALSAFRCTACHRREGVGGVPADRDAWFTSNGEDLGDEGRLPPRLDGVGDKLRPEWLRRVLEEGTGVRPYLRTRMPRFGATNVAFLADRLVARDRNARPVPPVADAPDALREAGRQLVGTAGLSCIACHRFNRQPAHALQVLDLLTTPGRLNEDWFHRFLRDPNAFNPGTRMPAFWPDGVSPLPTLLGGDTTRQHAAIWTYLGDGPRARFPEGLSRQGVEVTVGGEAVVYRGKLWEAGFRAVAVGHPGGWNLAFDAEEVRLALAWRGRFLNAGPHWGVQGMGQIRPLGTGVAVFPHGPAFAVLPDPAAPWPTEAPRSLGLRFRGYQLDALRRPTLLYAVQDMPVEDLLSPRDSADGTGGLHRILTLGNRPKPGLHLRLASGSLKELPGPAWRLDETVTLRGPSDARAFLRGPPGKQELLLPIPDQAAPIRLEVDYVW